MREGQIRKATNQNVWSLVLKVGKIRSEPILESLLLLVAKSSTVPDHDFLKGITKKRVLASDIDANQKKTPMKEIIGHEGLISHFCRHYNSWHSVKIIKKFSFSCTAALHRVKLELYYNHV